MRRLEAQLYVWLQEQAAIPARAIRPHFSRRWRSRRYFSVFLDDRHGGVAGERR